MKRVLLATLTALIAVPALADDLSVSIGINRPGFFGQINIGALPPPALIYAAPVVVERPPEMVAVEPIYLHVPPGYEKHWRRHCAEYDACGRPVYFVREDWYQREYVPRHHHEDAEDRGEYDHHGRGHGHGHGHDHEDRED